MSDTDRLITEKATAAPSTVGPARARWFGVTAAALALSASALLSVGCSRTSIESLDGEPDLRVLRWDELDGGEADGAVSPEPEVVEAPGTDAPEPSQPSPGIEPTAEPGPVTGQEPEDPCGPDDARCARSDDALLGFCDGDSWLRCELADDGCWVVVEDEADGDLGSAIGASISVGSTSGRTDDWHASCADGAESADVAYVWTAPIAGCYRASTVGSTYDTALHVRAACPAGNELACNDDLVDVTSEVTFDASPETPVLIIVDGYASGSTGEFSLAIWSCDEICDDGVDNDGNDLLDCDDPPCIGSPGCLGPEQCNGGQDEDGDGAVDCDDDDCAGAPSCGEDCTDGIDNDADGDVDCSDSECTGEPQCAMCAVVEVFLGSALGDAVAEGSTLRGENNHLSSCADGSLGSDVVHSWVTPDDGCYVISTHGSDFDTSLHVHGACPDFVELECNDDSEEDLTSELRLFSEANTEYLIVVDGYDENEAGTYQLNITGCGEICDDGMDNDDDGAVDCADSDCAADASCLGEDCKDGVDNDGDGSADCNDPECLDEAVCAETCDNGSDDNGNGAVDCADLVCQGDEACGMCPVIDENLGSVTGEVATGSTTNMGADVDALCAAGAESPDVVFSWTAPSDGCFQFDLLGSGYDTALHVHSLCPAFEELACNDDDEENDTLQSLLQLAVDAGQTYLVIVDGYSDDSWGSFRLNINPCN